MGASTDVHGFHGAYVVGGERTTDLTRNDGPTS